MITVFSDVTPCSFVDKGIWTHLKGSLITEAIQPSWFFLAALSVYRLHSVVQQDDWYIRKDLKGNCLNEVLSSHLPWRTEENHKRNTWELWRSCRDSNRVYVEYMCRELLFDWTTFELLFVGSCTTLAGCSPDIRQVCWPPAAEDFYPRRIWRRGACTAYLACEYDQVYTGRTGHSFETRVELQYAPEDSVLKLTHLERSYAFVPGA